MTLLDDILAWAKHLPAWQQEGLRRLFRGDLLAEADLDEIRAMVEASVTNAKRPTTVALTANDIPQLGPGGTTTLLGLRDMRQINGFPDGRCIHFEPQGLNVVFGENGAGKSGYARVLKQACRARRRARVLPNAFSQGATGQSSAQIVFLDQGRQQIAPWKGNTPSDPRLAMVSVYDSACGGDYISAEGPCAFQPYGLAHLQRLGAAQRELQSRIDRERQNIRISMTSLAALQGDHEVGKRLADLGPDTNVEELRNLAKLTPDQEARMTVIRATLQAMDVEGDALRAEILAQRLTLSIPNAGLAQRLTEDEALARARKYWDAEAAALRADALAQRELHGIAGEPIGSDAPSQGPELLLPGTGNGEWKILFMAAEEFSRHDAYPSHQSHPSSEEGAKCVLCQTTLAPDARQRMERFKRFVADKASTNLAEATSALREAMDKVERAEFSLFDEPTLKELKATEPFLFEAIAQSSAAWHARRTWMKERAAAGDWNSEPPILPPGAPLSEQLKSKAQALTIHAAELRRSKDIDQQVVLLTVS